MHNLREIRNICAHHSYLWNKTLSNHILKDKDVSIFQYNNKIYDSIIITQKLLNQITPGYDFFQDIEHLISHYEIQYLEEMGFPENWKDVFDTNRPDSSE
ncbi:MAG: hypothetical protein U9Q15_05545 [Patescibacteria group bacterium]|nr:hypothetical protein [Patescibacteria group bacterium]